MAYNELLAQKIRNKLTDTPLVEEKKMFGGLTFMVDGKMCVGVLKDELMVRLDPAQYAMALTKRGCREMDMMQQPMPGFVLVSNDGLQTEDEWGFWLGLALEYNKTAKPAKKRK
jgi:TfoX/Sxy family transcriptional regulator of competence genes